MKVNVYLKHIIIPVIVFMVTFFVVIYQFKMITTNTQLDIAYIYSGSDLVSESEQKKIWESLIGIQSNYIQEDENEIENIMIQNANTNRISLENFKRLSENNKIIVLYSDIYNESLESIISTNKKTTFILVDNDMLLNDKNVINISFNEKKLMQDSANKLLENASNENYLFIDDKESESTKELFEVFKNELGNNNFKNVEYLKVKDINDNISILRNLYNKYDEGYQNVLVTNKELNKIVFESIRTYKIDNPEKEMNLVILENELKYNKFKEQGTEFIINSYENELNIILPKVINKIANGEAPDNSYELHYDLNN